MQLREPTRPRFDGPLHQRYPGVRGLVGHDGGPVWGMPWPTGVDQTGPARCGDAGRSSRRSSACWTARSRARARSCSSKGEPGTRKSLLLARAGEEAGHRGFLLVVAAAGELSPAPLVAAVNAARATPGNGAGRRVTTAPAPRADVVLAGLEELASAGPVLVTATTSSGPMQPPCRPAGPCHGCWRPTRCPGSWPWARQLTPVRPSERAAPAVLPAAGPVRLHQGGTAMSTFTSNFAPDRGDARLADLAGTRPARHAERDGRRTPRPRSTCRSEQPCRSTSPRPEPRRARHQPARTPSIPWHCLLLTW